MSFVKNMLIAAFVVGSLGATVALSSNVSATTRAACTVTGVEPNVGTPVADREFTILGDKAYIDVKVTGTDCRETVSLAAWETPNESGRPLSEQKLVDHITKTFTEGTHRMSIKIPNCFYQIDLVRGSSPTAADGTPAYEKGRFITSIRGGTQKCETPTPPKIKVCELATKKIIRIDEKAFDATKHSRDLSKCAPTPVVPGEITVCVIETGTIINIKETDFDGAVHTKDLTVCEETPEVIASTGPVQALSGLFGISALAGSAQYYLQSRRRK